VIELLAARLNAQVRLLCVRVGTRLPGRFPVGWYISSSGDGRAPPGEVRIEPRAPQNSSITATKNVEWRGMALGSASRAGKFQLSTRPRVSQSPQGAPISGTRHGSLSCVVRKTAAYHPQLTPRRIDLRYFASFLRVQIPRLGGVRSGLDKDFSTRLAAQLSSTACWLYNSLR
jgi:hypothetical protein